MANGMTPAEFTTIGRALYGPKWQRALATALGIGERQVRFYSKAPDAGGRSMPADMGARLARLLYGQAQQLTTLAKRIKL